jgi:hypothetical protein
MHHFPSFIASMVLGMAAHAGESMLSTTFQPLDGLGSGTIRIVEVTCHDWYGMSGQPTGIGLISAPNIPPTNNPKEAKEDLNLASACGLRFGCGDVDSTMELTLEATAFSVPQRFGHSPEHVLRASLECLRRCLPEKLRRTAVTLKAAGADMEWMGKIITEFNTHDRTKVFFTPTK